MRNRGRYAAQMATETVENYLKAVESLSRTGEVGVVRLAKELGLTKGTVTSMVQRLARRGLLRAPRYGNIVLTAQGRRKALDVLRRHRIIECFLVRFIGLDWSEVHAEAERLEHALSPRVLRRLDGLLGHPSRDPHGDPIPSARGRVRAAQGVPLDSLPTGSTARVERVMLQSTQFLREAARYGLRPGAGIVVMQAASGAAPLRLRVGRSAPIRLRRSTAKLVTAVEVKAQRRRPQGKSGSRLPLRHGGID